MKFFWKIYFSFTVLFLLAFGLFGTWMIQMTFQQSYQKALKDENGIIECTSWLLKPA